MSAQRNGTAGRFGGRERFSETSVCKSCIPMTVRRIAAHLLWTPGGIVRHPVAEVGEYGDVRWIGTSADPDREPFTAFFAGLLVPDFPRDFRAVFARMQMQLDIPLAEALAAVVYHV